MSEDRLLRDLGQLAKEEEGAERARLDERWDRLAAGTLTPEEEAELRALAETSPEAREAWEAFRPLGPEFQARVVEKIAAELPQEKKGRLLPFRPARILGWATAAAAAAAVAVVLLRPSAAPLPDYQIVSISGGSSEMRGEQPRDFAPGDRIGVRLRPARESRAGRLEGQLFLVRNGELRRLETKSESHPEGAVEITGTLGHDLQQGTWTLWAVVGRQGDLPEPAELRSRGGPGREEDWVLVAGDIQIRPRGP